MTAYVVLRDRVCDGNPCAKVGDKVYRCIRYDYGYSSEDTEETGFIHIAVTHNSNGDYPCFTIPVIDLKVVQEN